MRKGSIAGTSQAKRGGKALLAAYGPDYFRDLGRKGGNANKERSAVDYSRIGRKGGETTKLRYGNEHFAEIGRRGGKKRKRVAND